MNEQMPDRTIIAIILVTILLVFTLIFSLRPSDRIMEPTMQWKDMPTSRSGSLEI